MVSSAQKMDGPADRAAEGLAVLVVDDNPGVTRALSRLLEQNGYRAAVCHTGAEALAYARCHRPAAALVDIHLPDVCGLALSSELRAHFGEGACPIIVLSGDASIENLKRLPDAGASYFLSKPFKSEHLVERLKELTVS
jgi:CheY-like chemotaxis protein